MKELDSYNFQEGVVLLIDKPIDYTSFDVVARIRNKVRSLFLASGTKKIKVGHAGTLDPLATGLLIIATGKMTKSLAKFTNQDKEYEGTFILGGSTPSYDAEFPPDKTFDTSNLTERMVKEVTEKFIGEIWQKPPLYSAVKVGGQRLYKKVRKNKDAKVELPPREVEIHEIELTRIDIPNVDFRVRCGSGTYIRSLAHDIGQELNNGAYLSALRRTMIGDYHVDDAWQLEEFLEHLEQKAPGKTIKSKT
ncbi:MAG: tRNA pseudouridine(55) synthase TruB [Bacteroidetes bacterium]|nr:tRNA pseudouridine(55) synthase TruB [Bacteroidota bacterium]